MRRMLTKFREWLLPLIFLAVILWAIGSVEAQTNKTKSQVAAAPTGITNYDVIVVGANYGGLITGAILSRNGLKTLVVDELEELELVGGRLGCVFYNGYWLDWGSRDAKDFADSGFVGMERGQYNKKAAEAAGVDAAWVTIKPNILVHRKVDGKVVDWYGAPDAFIKFATEALDLSKNQATQFVSMIKSLAGEDPQKWMAVTMKEYLRTIEDKAIYEAFLRLGMLSYAVPLEESSVGRWIELLRNPLETYRINDPEVGGLQGLVKSYVRVIRNHGGEIKLGLQTGEISVEGNRVTGIVVRDKRMMVQEFHAPVVVFNYPIWEVFKMLGESHFPKEVAENAWKLEPCYRGDVVVKSIGVSRVPTIRATGQADRNMAFNQFVEVTDGWYIPTLSSKQQAPPGKHLLSVVATGGKEFIPLSFEEKKARVEAVHEYMRRYYSDLDEITEWVSSYQWLKAWVTSSCWSPAPRSPLQVRGLDGLYFVGQTVEVDGLYQEIEANSALQATQSILQRRGKRQEK